MRRDRENASREMSRQADAGEARQAAAAAAADTHTIWICPDCVQLLANGEVADDAEQPPMRLLEGEDVTLGLMADEHEPGCTAVEDGTECECEDRTFSHDRCEGCGGLPGARMAATIWEREEDDPGSFEAGSVELACVLGIVCCLTVAVFCYAILSGMAV